MEKGFLRSYEFVGRGAETVLRMSVGRGPEVSSQPSSSAVQSPESSRRSYVPGDGSLVEMLVQRGIAEYQAKRLVDGKSPTELIYLRRIVAYVDHLVSQGDNKISRNPAGFLSRAVSSP